MAQKKKKKIKEWEKETALDYYNRTHNISKEEQKKLSKLNADIIAGRTINPASEQKYKQLNDIQKRKVGEATKAFFNEKYSLTNDNGLKYKDISKNLFQTGYKRFSLYDGDNRKTYLQKQKELQTGKKITEIKQKDLEEINKKAEKLKSKKKLDKEINTQYLTQYLEDEEKVNSEEITFLDKINVLRPMIVGLENALSPREYTNENGVKVDLPSYSELKEDKTYQELGFLGKAVHGSAQSIGQMLPSIAVGLIPGIGKIGALATTFATSYNSAKNQKLLEGYSEEKANSYAILNAGLEAGLGRLIGGATKMMGGTSSPLAKNLSNISEKVIKNKGVSRILGHLGAEEAEELTQMVLDPINEYVTLGEYENLGEALSTLNGEEAGLTALSTLITIGLTEGQTSYNLSKLQKNVEQINKQYGTDFKLKQNAQIINNQTGETITQQEINDQITRQSKIKQLQEQELINIEQSKQELENNFQNGIITEEQYEQEINNLSNRLKTFTQEIQTNKANPITEIEVEKQILDEEFNNNQITEEEYNNRLSTLDNSLKELSINSQTTTNTNKIEIFRETANEYWDNSKESQEVKNLIEKVIKDKDYNIILDPTIGNNIGGLATTNQNGEVEIRLNPNSNRAVEFLLVHEVTHAIENSSMKKFVMNFARKNPNFVRENPTFKNALKSLEQTYNSEDVSSEVLADISGQLLGNQEFINSLAMQNTAESKSIIKTIYEEIKRLLNTLTKEGRYRNFVQDLETKWRDAYRTTTTEEAVNNLNNETKLSTIGIKGAKNLSRNSDIREYRNLYQNQREAQNIHETSKQDLENTNIKSKQNTGWFKTKYGDWGTLISDKDAKLTQKLEPNKTYRLGDIFEHDNLYKAYPQLKNLKVKTADIDSTGVFAEVPFIPSNTIIDDIKLRNSDLNKKNFKTTLLHEINHYIVKAEKYNKNSRGANSQTNTKEEYNNNLGEIISNETKINSNLTQEELNNIILPEQAKNNPKYENIKEKLIESNKKDYYNHGGKRNAIQNMESSIQNKIKNTKMDNSKNSKHNRIKNNVQELDNSSFSYDKQGEILSEQQETRKKYSEMSEKELDAEVQNLEKEINDNVEKRVKIADEHLKEWQEFSRDGYYYAEDKRQFMEENYPEYRKLSEEFETLDKKRAEINNIKDNKSALKRLDKMEEITSNHRFYSDDIEVIAGSILPSDIRSVEKTQGLIGLDEVLKKEGMIVSESPYSFSVYGIKQGEEITWGSKPKNSYRLSDHWNFESQGEIHCKLTGVNKYTQKVILAKYNGKTYDIVETFDNENSQKELATTNNTKYSVQGSNINQNIINDIKEFQNNSNADIEGYKGSYIKEMLKIANIKVPSSFDYITEVRPDFSYTTTKNLTRAQHQSIANALLKLKDFDISILNNQQSITPKPTWQKFLDDNYKATGKRTNMADIKRTTSPNTNTNTESKTSQNKNLLPINKEVKKAVEPIKKDITDISKQITEIREKLGIKNPVEISKITKEDANTTPKLPSKKVSTGDGDSSFFENVTKKTKMLSEKSRDIIKTEDDVAYYEKVTNEESLSKAMERLDTGGRNETLTWFNKDSKHADSTDVAEGWILLKQYQDAKDYDSMVEVAKKMREIGTKAGQTVQAFNIMERLTPEGMVKYAQSELSEAYDKMIKNKTKEWIDKHRSDFDLKPAEVEFIMRNMEDVSKMEDGYDKRVKLAEIQKLMTDKLPPERGAGVKAWMRISMLFNPKTQVRNIVGNALISPVNMVGDTFASMIDRQIAKKTGVRTTGITNLKNYTKGMKEGLYQSYNDFKKGINTRNVQGNRFEIGEGKSFNNKTIIGKGLNRVDNMLSFMLDAGDRAFYEASFTNSINNQLVLNKTDTVTQDMIDIATEEALSRTWQDNNKFTQFVLRTRKGLNNLAGNENFGLGDVLIPFAKTPANLTKALIDYSPAGMISTITKGINLKKSISNGQYTPQMQHQFVQNLGKATAGTMLYVLGYALAEAGITSGAGDDDKDVANFLKNTLGINNYSIKIGDKSFTYDWAQPVAGAFSIMANVVNSEEKEKALAEAIIGNLDTAGAILLEQSFLQSINDVINNNDGAVSGMITEILELPSRALPTFSKQIADMIDGTQRTSFEKGSPIKTSINQVKAKLPFVSKTLAPSVDSLGREIQKYGGKNNVFNVFFNPANLNSENVNEAGKELYRLYKETGDKTVMPRVVPYTVEINGEKKDLSSVERAKYQKESGKIVEEEMNRLLKSSKYTKLSNEEKVEVTSDIINYAYNKIQEKMFRKEIASEYKNADKFVSKGGTIADYYRINNNLKWIENEYEYKKDLLNENSSNYASNSEKLSSTKRKNIINSIINENINKEAKAFIYNKYYGSETTTQSIVNSGINFNEYLKFVRTDYKSDKDSEGNSIKDSRKKKVFNAINKLNLNKVEKAMLVRLEYTSFDDYNYQIFKHIDDLNLSKKQKETMFETFGFEVKGGRVYW